MRQIKQFQCDVDPIDTTFFPYERDKRRVLAVAILLSRTMLRIHDCDTSGDATDILLPFSATRVFPLGDGGILIEREMSSNFLMEVESDSNPHRFYALSQPESSLSIVSFTPSESPNLSSISLNDVMKKHSKIVTVSDNHICMHDGVVDELIFFSIEHMSACAPDYNASNIMSVSNEETSQSGERATAALYRIDRGRPKMARSQQYGGRHKVAAGVDGSVRTGQGNIHQLPHILGVKPMSPNARIWLLDNSNNNSISETSAEFVMRPLLRVTSDRFRKHPTDNGSCDYRPVDVSVLWEVNSQHLEIPGCRDMRFLYILDERTHILSVCRVVDPYNSVTETILQINSCATIQSSTLFVDGISRMDGIHMSTTSNINLEGKLRECNRQTWSSVDAICVISTEVIQNLTT
jgi:hypothetical protein